VQQQGGSASGSGGSSSSSTSSSSSVAAEAEALCGELNARLAQWEAAAAAQEAGGGGGAAAVAPPQPPAHPFVPGSAHCFPAMALDVVSAALAPACAALRGGLGEVLPLGLAALAGWRAVAGEACGAAALDVEALRAGCRLVGWAPGSPTPALFFAVLRAMAGAEQEEVLRFVFARRRLPARGGPALVLARMARADPDASLPMGHTCAGQLDLPEYSCASAMRAALLRAARLCTAFDLDGGAAGL
jgi:hypothetical protein